MTHERPPVALVQVPDAISARQERMFLSELEDFMKTGRPRIVLDCSKLRQMDKAAIHLLLCCLEEAMKRNGDVKLAAIPGEASAAFGLFELEGLFEVFETIPSAVNSFQPAPASMISQQDVSRGSNQLL